MESSTTIKQMLACNNISVPAYQRAYAWETESEPSKTAKHVNIFLSDLEDYVKSGTESPYYFGHFLFERKSENSFCVIDGQQRLTTIVIFLSALFARLKSLRELTENERETFEDIIKRNSTYRFTTVDYDDQLFKDYVIDRTKQDHNGLDTESKKRIVQAFDYLTDKLSKKSEDELLKLLSAVQRAACTTHPVKNESEAIQIFIFQNNRGKQPSDLEIIKAQFMFNVHLYGGAEKDGLIEEIKNRFRTIYTSISSIEKKIDEDDILGYTQRVYFNSLWESNPKEKINSELAKDSRLTFIKEFTQSLTASFEHLKTFFGEDEKEHIAIHSLVTLGGFAPAIPFIIKAYTFGLPIDDICKLCTSLEKLVLRDKVIGTRADITSRINGVYQKFTTENPNVEDIINHIHWVITMEKESWWWAYWNNDALKNALQGQLNHTVAKFLLWRYEYYLQDKDVKGYKPNRYDQIESPELEHIAPKTENPNAGYDTYDEEFKNQYLECLGNYLLISKSHNGSIGNEPFLDKFKSYNYLAQQREVKTLSESTKRWTRDLIQQRKENIIDFILKTF